MTRPSWDEYFHTLASAAATRSTCPRLAVGAVLVKGKRVIGTGYNGAPPGEAHCEDVGCNLQPCSHMSYINWTTKEAVPQHPDGHCKRAIHAEVNALINALVPAWGATLYTTHQPCPDCRTALEKAGVQDFRWRTAYP